MKSRYYIRIPGIFILLLALQIVFLKPGYSQDHPIESAGPELSVDNGFPVIAEKPVQYATLTPLSPGETHSLAGLTPAERQAIAEKVNPPAIGMVRYFADPVRFRLTASDLPGMGERTFAGGRMNRGNNDTIVWTTSVRSEGAEEIRIVFRDGNFPAGVKVNLFGNDGQAFNQFELQGLLSEFGFYTTTIFGDYLVLQVVVPVTALKEEFYFTVPGIVHASGRPVPDAPNVDCFEDVNCAYASSYASIGVLKGSTAQLTFVDGGYYYICSGGLLNDLRAGDLQPFLLTANHCFSTQASALSLEARFNMFTTYCNGPVNPGVLLINGSNLLATNSQTDVTMVLLKGNPGGGQWYLGWTTGEPANDQTLHSVNHPAGTPQKYMRQLKKTSPDFSCGGLPVDNFHYTRLLGGESVGGSSGGAITNEGSQVVGQLYGWCYLTGATECNYSTFYNVWGKFGVSYYSNNLQYWLANGGSSVSMTTSPASSLSFGTVNVGSYYDLNVTVTNNGSVPNYLNLEAGSAYLSGTDPGQFSIIGPGYLYLAPGASGTITVRFAPTTGGIKTALLNLPHNANNIASPKVITLVGNDGPCLNIIPLDGGGSVNAKTYSKSGTGQWYTSWGNPCGYYTPGVEQVYSFTAPVTGYYSLEVTSSNNYYVDYLWRADNCDGTVWNCIDDVYYPGTYGAMYWYAGTTYYILADAETTSLATQSFYIFYNPCLNVTTIAGTGPANSQTYMNGGDGAWFSGSASPCGYWCPAREQVYSFVAPYSGYYMLEVTNGSAWVDYMWNTSCGPSGWNCIDDIYYPGLIGPVYWTQGVTYYILADGETTDGGPHTFHINPPDPCLSIPSMVCNQAMDFQSAGAGVWDTYACSFSCPGAERVYSFTAPSTGEYSVMVNTVSGGWYVDYMWSTSCAGPWVCIDDISSPGQYGSMSWTAGTTYYILLDDEDLAASGHNFTIICPELCHACNIYDFPIEPSNDWQTHSSSIESNGCKNYRFYAYPGLVYSFKTGCGNGASATFDSYLDLYDANCTLVTYNDDGCESNRSSIVWTPPASGYYILKVRGYSPGWFGDYTLAYSSCYQSPDPPGYISGPSTAVSGWSYNYSIPASPGATYYSWSYSGGGTITGSETSITLEPAASGTLSVFATNDCGSGSSTSMYIEVIPVSLPVGDIVITPGSQVCYAAGQTITVAGAGTYFYLLNGGSATFVAGENIFFMPGTTVYPGGYMHGYITTSGDYCLFVPAKSGGSDGEGVAGEQILPAVSGDDFFKVFPNPTSGDFTLELSSEPEGSVVTVQLYNLLGGLIQDRELESGRSHHFTLVNQCPGLYIIKVSGNGKSGMQKIVRQ